MNTPKGAASSVAQIPQTDGFPASLVEIAVSLNIPIVALNSDATTTHPAILFVNADLLPDCLDALLPTLSRLTAAS